MVNAGVRNSTGSNVGNILCTGRCQPVAASPWAEILGKFSCLSAWASKSSYVLQKPYSSR